MNISNQIKAATQEDLEILVRLSIQTFRETYAGMNNPDNLKAFIENNFNEELLQSELNQPGNYFFISFHNQYPSGYLKLGPGIEAPDDGLIKVLEIERIYVLKSFQGQHAGTALMEHTDQFASAAKYDAVTLAVWEKNMKAIEFYRRKGFIPKGSRLFMMGEEAQQDIVMIKKIDR